MPDLRADLRPDFRIETDRLVLRNWAPGDIDRFAAVAEVAAFTVLENAAGWGLMERLGMRRREDLDYVDDRFDSPLQRAWSIGPDAWRSQSL